MSERYMFQSPRGDSMVATADYRRSYVEGSVKVSVPSRGFDGCNRMTGRIITLRNCQFQSPRGDSRVATTVSFMS